MSDEGQEVRNMDANPSIMGNAFFLLVARLNPHPPGLSFGLLLNQNEPLSHSAYNSALALH